LLSVVQISSDNTLTISNIQREDAGSYKCSAANFVGRITSVAYVKVNGKHACCTCVVWGTVLLLKVKWSLWDTAQHSTFIAHKMEIYTVGE